MTRDAALTMVLIRDRLYTTGAQGKAGERTAQRHMELTEITAGRRRHKQL